MPSDDTAISLLRFWLFMKALKLLLWIAPNGDSKTLLIAKIGEWAIENERQWYLRYPRKAKP